MNATYPGAAAGSVTGTTSPAVAKGDAGRARVARCDPGPFVVATPVPKTVTGGTSNPGGATKNSNERLPVKGSKAALDVVAHRGVTQRTKRARTTARMGLPSRSGSQQDSFRVEIRFRAEISTYTVFRAAAKEEEGEEFATNGRGLLSRQRPDAAPPRGRGRRRGIMARDHKGRLRVTRRVCFEVRILGVATADRFYFEDEIPTDVDVPTVGEFAGPVHSTTAWRRVVALGRMGEMTVITLEPIDCSQLKRDQIYEEAALREAGWKR